MDQRCHTVLTNGQRCRAYRLSDSEFCFSHSPHKALERKQARALGGHNRNLPRPRKAKPIKVENHEDLVGLLNETINQLRRGELNAKEASSIGFLANSISPLLDRIKSDEKLAPPEPESFRYEIIGYEGGATVEDIKEIMDTYLDKPRIPNPGSS